MRFLLGAIVVTAALIPGARRMEGAAPKALLHASGEYVVLSRAVFSPDGKFVAAVFRNDIVVWTGEDGNEVKVLSGHTKPVYAIAFSADGRVFASVDMDGILRLWGGAHDWKSGASVEWRVPHTKPFKGDGRKRAGERNGAVIVPGAFALSPDGRMLLYGGILDTGVKIRRVQSGEEVNTLGEEVASLEVQGACDSAAFSADGTAVVLGVVGSLKKPKSGVQVWNVPGFERQKTFSVAESGAICSALSGNKRFLAAVVGNRRGARDKRPDERRLVLWDTRTGESFELSADPRLYGCLEFSSDNRTLAVGTTGPRPQVLLWDVETRTAHSPLDHDLGATAVMSVAFSPDGKKLVTGLAHSPELVHLWTLPGGDTYRDGAHNEYPRE